MKNRMYTINHILNYAQDIKVVLITALYKERLS